jgi:hypothetical protein
MFETPFEREWKVLSNPFRGRPEIGEMIIGHVSGRSGDIQEIVMGGQSAIILSGVPYIGKTSLVRYLQRPLSAEWSWRDELASLDIYSSIGLNEIHFAQIDLTPLEGIANVASLLESFVAQCIAALQSVRPHDSDEYTDIDRKGLRELLRRMTRERPDARYFVMLDTIERLQQPDMPALTIPSKAQTPQERAMALLDDCGAFRLLVDLMDEFTQLGVILSIDSQPSPKIGDQFTHVSADLARFRTMTLQTYTYEDTQLLLAQKPESFGAGWARQFRDAGGDLLFSDSEQMWLYEQAGTHPYLLQQFCFHTFHFKREYTLRQGSWSDLQKNDREQLIERVNERVSTFLDRTWKRVKESLDVSSQETKDRFYDFIAESRGKSAREEIGPEIWNQLGLELRYILYSEGIIHYDLLQPIYYPGSVLLNYLAQKAQEQGKLSTPVVLPQSQAMMSNANELIITMPGKEPVYLELSLLEYHLIKTLLRYPKRCTEEELMKAAWGRIIGKQVFTQRMHHLRKKLREYSEGEEVIENRYGGFYLLNHAEWFHLS